MPIYELLLVLRPAPKNEVVDCLKRVANLIWKEGGVLKRINYIGFNKLPFKIISHDQGEKYYEANYFLYDISLAQSKIPNLSPEFKLDLDIIKASFNHKNSSPLPEDYECTLDEELQPPALRASVQPLLENKNVRANVRRMKSTSDEPGPQSTSSPSSTSKSEEKGPGLLAILESKRLTRIKFLADLFTASGFELRIAGGAVRDIIKGVHPQDLDFATDARPEQTLEILSKHEDVLRIIVTTAGQRHGTVAVKFKEVALKKTKLDQDNPQPGTSTGITAPAASKPEYDNESPFEITTLRRDKITDGRHAEVQFINDWKLDAERRDLTINAMFLTLDKGKLIDYFDGESDLKKGIVRFVGDPELRIKEDYLRILRFFRFWSRYGRQRDPDPETMIKIHRGMDGLESISGERLWTEMKKILSHLPCIDVVELMLKSKVFPYLGVDIGGDCDESERYFGRVLERLKTHQSRIGLYIDKKLNPDLLLNPRNVEQRRFKELIPAILFSTLIENPEMLKAAHERMKFSNVEKDCIEYIVKQRGLNKTGSIQDHVNDLRYRLAMAPPQDRPMILLKEKALQVYFAGPSWEDLEWKVPNFPITGIMVSQEIKKRKLPNDKIKVVLDQLKSKWVDSDFSLTKSQLESLMNEQLDSMQSES